MGAGGSDFTLLFEALVMALAKEMPVKAIAGLVGEHDTKIWRIVHHYVDLAVEAQDLAGTERLGIDDTSFRRGQDYVSVFCDLDPGERRAVFVTEGRDHQTVEQFAGFLTDHGGDPERITEVCQDMSQAYLAGVRDHLPKARVTFDRYHVKQKLSEAIDTVRRAEAKQHKELLKGTRYLWLKRPDNLTVKQLDWLDQLLLQPLNGARLGAGAEVRRLLRAPGSHHGRGVPAPVGRRGQGQRAGAADQVRRDARGALGGYSADKTRVSNGLLEGLNSLIQAAKRRARGYRSARNYKTMIYLVAGKLNPGPQVT